ncbi:MAG: hypothetical protein Q7V01_03865 [Vicinamibacterales bacterium]|nr:hypothetical protein [Vicinamibacterales bacterium]
MDDVTSIMSRLPDPDPPATLTATVMARIAREVDQGADAPEVRVRHREYRAWAWALAGVVLVFGVSIYGWYATGSTPDLTSSRIGPGRPALMPIGGPVSALLGLGLLVYIVGLFAPLRRDKT